LFVLIAANIELRDPGIRAIDELAVVLGEEDVDPRLFVESILAFLYWAKELV
jgi:hypothetical protein